MTLEEYSFVECSPEGHNRRIDPDIEAQLIGFKRAAKPERAAQTLYEEYFNHDTKNLRHKFNEPFKYLFGEAELQPSWDTGPYLSKSLLMDLQIWIENELGETMTGDPISEIENNGLPDLFVVRSVDELDYCFVEVKRPDEQLLNSQIKWMRKFEFLDYRVIFVSRHNTQLDNIYQDFNLSEEIST